VLFQKGALFRCRFASEYDVAMGETTETRDDVAMSCGKIEGARKELLLCRFCGLRKRLVAVHAQRLVMGILAVFERQIEEYALDGPQTLVMLGAEACLAVPPGDGITGECIGGVAMDDARKLVKRDDEREAAVCGFGPAVEFALPSGLERICEPRSDIGILFGALAPPKRGLGLVHSKVVLSLAKPELMDLRWSTNGHGRRLADKGARRKASACVVQGGAVGVRAYQETPLSTIGFIVKKLLTHLCYPLTLCLLAFVIGLVLLRLERWRRAGKYALGIGFGLVFLFTFSPLPSWMLRPLEWQYEPLDYAPGDPVPNVPWVVVLGGGHSGTHDLPPTARLNRATLARLVEGVRQHRLHPGSKLVLSGGSVYGEIANAEVLAAAAESLGVPRADMLIEAESKDTHDEAVILKDVLGSDAFVMVTSASHMPRAVALFRKQGLEPTPAPTDYQSKKSGINFTPSFFFPSTTGFTRGQRAAHEYLGLLWSKLRGQL
jgi:uncharacterized SAM-binding protein YcdF (DUF218 family)